MLSKNKKYNSKCFVKIPPITSFTTVRACCVDTSNCTPVGVRFHKFYIGIFCLMY